VGWHWPVTVQLCQTNSTWTWLELNPGLRKNRPATNRLSRGTDTITTDDGRTEGHGRRWFQPNLWHEADFSPTNTSFVSNSGESLSFLLPVRSTSNYTGSFIRHYTEVTKDTVGEMARNNQQVVLQKLSMERIKKLSALPKAWENISKTSVRKNRQSWDRIWTRGTPHKKQVPWGDDRKARNYSIYKNKAPKC
jgi:hypothetical protein